MKKRDNSVKSLTVKLKLFATDIPGIQSLTFVQVRFGSDLLRYCAVKTNITKKKKQQASSLAFDSVKFCTAMKPFSLWDSCHCLWIQLLWGRKLIPCGCRFASCLYIGTHWCQNPVSKWIQLYVYCFSHTYKFEMSVWVLLHSPIRLYQKNSSNSVVTQHNYQINDETWNSRRGKQRLHST